LSEKQVNMKGKKLTAKIWKLFRGKLYNFQVTFLEGKSYKEYNEGFKNVKISRL
jgi:hypothetical protein